LAITSQCTYATPFRQGGELRQPVQPLQWQHRLPMAHGRSAERYVHVAVAQLTHILLCSFRLLCTCLCVALLACVGKNCAVYVRDPLAATLGLRGP